MATTTTIPLPQPELERVAKANAAVALATQELFDISKEIENPDLAQRLRREISKIVDQLEQITSAVRTANYMKR